MSKRKPFHSLCASLLALCLGFASIPAMAQSQANTGQITGHVTDAQGAAVAKAKVKVANTQTGLERTIETSDDGLYSAVLLPPGIYKVSVEASGFATKTVDNVEVIVGRTIDTNVSLGTGGVEEIVNVTAGAVQVQTTRPEADTVVNEAAIANLPINGRRFHDFITLTPTAQVDPSRGQISLVGQRSTYGANINVDGADYNQPFFGGIRGGERSNNAFTLPLEAIKEFQVVPAGYSAEFGRSTGGVVNAVTKSGTNSYHGSGYYVIRPEQLAAKTDFFNALEENLGRDVRPAPTQQQFGGSFGAPIKKDRMFIFGAYEQQRFRNQREVFFDRLASFTPTAATQEAFDFYKSLQTPFDATNDAKAFIVRFDHEISANHRYNIRFSRSTNNALNANATGNALFPTTVSALSNNGTEQDRLWTIVGQATSFLSATMVNEFRGQFAREDRPRPANALQPNVTDAIGNFGTVSFLGVNQEFDKRTQVSDNITWTRGNHTFKFGGEFNHIYVNQDFGFNQFGAFSVSGSDTATLLDILSFTPSISGGTVNRFDSRSVTYSRQLGNLFVDYASNQLAFFGQDSWRIKPNFTINYGLRWEAQYNPSPEANNDALINQIKGFKFPSGDVVDPTVIRDDTKMFAPRVGFAWDPTKDGKTVMRGFAGIYYAATPLILLAAPMNNFRLPAGDLSALFPLGASNIADNTVYKQFKLIGIDLNTTPLGSLPILSVDQVQGIIQALVNKGELASFNPFSGAQPILMAPDYHNPRSYQGGIGIEREVAHGLTVGADFNYVKTVYLERDRDLNLPLPILRSTATDPAQRPFYGIRFTDPACATTPGACLRPIASLGAVTERASTGKSLYRALIVRAKFQRKWGQFNAAYVLSKNLTDDDNERDASGFRYENAFNVTPEYADSLLDRRHQFTFSPTFYLPWDFEVSSGVRVLSGRPLDATIGTLATAGNSSDLNADRGGPDRPYAAPGIPFQRDAFRNKAFYGVDIRVQKRFKIGEGKAIQVFADMFNVLNLNNLELAGTTVTDFCKNPVTASCGFTTSTNPNFLQTVDRDPTSARFGSLLLNNNPGQVFQLQIGGRFQF